MARRKSFKVAPGVRITASRSGVRTSVGGKGAKVTFGGSRPAYISGGVGPVRAGGYVSSGSRGSATRSAPAPRPEVMSEAQQIAASEYQLQSLHLAEFPMGAPHGVVRPEPIDVSQLTSLRVREAVAHISRFKRSERAQAKAVASQLAREEAERYEREVDAWFARESQAAEREWSARVVGDPDAVIKALDGVFADNASPATCVDAGTDDGRRFATCVVVCDPQSSMPQRKVSTTPTGRLSIKARTKTEIAELYARHVASTVIAVVKEALATSPATEEVNVVALRRDPGAATPADYVAPIYVGTFDRDSCTLYDWSQVDVVEMLLRADGALLVRKGAAKELAAVDISADATLINLVNTFARAMLSR